MKEAKYQVMPAMSEDEYNDLKADIAKRGVLVPIELDEDGNVLDGHHRLRACEELGITDYPRIVREGLTEDEKIWHSYKLNTARRNLTPDQMLTLVADVLRRYPNKSNREIAAVLGISHPTVGKYRRQLEQMGQVEKVTTREGADGKTYPSERAGAKKTKGTPTDHPFLKWQCCICKQSFPAKCYNDGTISYDGMNNAWPLSFDGHCCKHCDDALVTPSRVALLMTKEEEGERAAKKMEMELLATDALTTFTTDADGAPDYELPRALAVMDVIGDAFDKVAQRDDVKPETLAYRIISIAEQANTLEAWVAARDAIEDMHQQWGELVELTEAKMAELTEAEEAELGEA